MVPARVLAITNCSVFAGGAGATFGSQTSRGERCCFLLPAPTGATVTCTPSFSVRSIKRGRRLNENIMGPIRAGNRARWLRQRQWRKVKAEAIAILKQAGGDGLH